MTAAAVERIAPFEDHRAHLLAELLHAELLLRAEAVRWQATIGRHKPERLLGVPQVDDGEIEALLGSEPGVAPEPPMAVRLMAQARRQRQLIDARLAASANTGLPLTRLQENAGLDGKARDLIVLLLLIERNERWRRLAGWIMDDATRPSPSAGLALRAVGATAALLSPAAPLRRLQLIHLEHAPDLPPGLRAIRLADRLADHIDGADAPDPDVQTAIRPATPPASLEAPAGLAATTRLLLLSGPYGCGRRAVAAAFACAQSRPLLLLDLLRLLETGSLEAILPIVHREAVLQGAVPAFAAIDRLPEASAAVVWTALAAAAAHLPWLSCLIGDELPEPRAGEAPPAWLHLRLQPPDYAGRVQVWHSVLSGMPAHAAGVDHMAATLAAKFRLTPGQVVDAVGAAAALARLRGGPAAAPTVGELVEGCRRRSGSRLLRFGRRISPTEGPALDDLVLPAAHRRQLAEVRARIALRHRLNDSIGGRHRLGRGFIALFAGASGTGKTMAAELLAREQGVDLYKVDLALVVSKYVGETEQRLREMFAEAQSLDAIVFFDEADALFGRRGDVKEARDRWANLEVNYLLQAVEEHDGVVILATNLKHGLDEAFARRIHAVIEFPLPDAAARLELWRRALPEPLLAPPEHELQELAQRLELSGAAIRNIAVDAIFRAAEADPAQGGAGPLQVQLRHLVHAAAREYQKLGRPIGESEFGPLWCAWARADLC